MIEASQISTGARSAFHSGRYKKIRKNLEIKSKEVNGETYVLCYNPDAAVRDETSRKVVLEKLQSKLDQLGASGLVKNRAYSKYLTTIVDRLKVASGCPRCLPEIKQIFLPRTIVP